MLRCWWLVCLAACAFETRIGGSPTDAGDGDGASGDGAPDAPAGTDRDGDTVPDDVDNCPDDANPDQADEDADVVGDVCDNCPHLANPNQDDAGEVAAGAAADGVGDVCDPEPDQPGNSIALFLPFNAPAEIATWQSAGTNAQFTVAGGRLAQTGATDLAILWKNGLGYAEAWITTEVTYQTIDMTKQFRGAAVMTRFVRNAGSFGYGVGCGELRDSAFMGGAPFFNMMRFDNGGFQNISHGTAGAVVAPTHTARYTVHRVTGTTHECTVSPSTTYSGSLGLAESNGTGINFAVWGATVSFHYLVVID